MAEELVTMYEDRQALSAILDTDRREQDVERQRPERDLRARLERAARLESQPDAAIEIAGGTGYPLRIAQMLQAKKRFVAAFDILIKDREVTRIERIHEIGQELIDLARPLGPAFQDHIDQINLYCVAADLYPNVFEEIGQGRGKAADEAFKEELLKKAAGRWLDEVRAAAASVRKPEESKTSAALAAAGEDYEKIRAILYDRSVPVRERLNAAAALANSALMAALEGTSELELSLRCAEFEVDLALQLTDRGADPRTIEHWLASIGQAGPAGYVGSALNLMQAVTAMVEGRERPSLSEAVVDRLAALAEGARGLIVARQFESRPDLRSLTEAHPDLANELLALASDLRADPDTLAERHAAHSPPPPVVTAGRAAWARLLKLTASEELDTLIERIRAEKGFEKFLRRLDPAQLREQAVDGPVVMLVCPDGEGFRHRGGTITPFAMVITKYQISAIRLNIDFSVLDDAADRWSAAIAGLSERGADRPSVSRVCELSDDLTAILSLTWHDVVKPILDAVGLAAPVAEGGYWPRLWWISEGPLHKLPLHAAQCQVRGCQRGGCGAALDCVASSYLPSVRTLARVRARDDSDAVHSGRRSRGRRRALVVAATDTDLPYAEAAARTAVRRLHRARFATDRLIGSAATRQTVLNRLAGAAWVHFGGHATSDPREPSGGLLHLPGGEVLTVAEVSSAHQEAARVAFLAACSTARATERLPGEAIHLSNAFLLAGFNAAIGTLWEVDSKDAYEVTCGFYVRVTARPGPSPALALHHAVRELRARRADPTYAWAAYVYSGA